MREHSPIYYIRPHNPNRKPDKDTTKIKSLQMNILMNIDIKILNKILAHQSQQCMKRKIY